MVSNGQTKRHQNYEAPSFGASLGFRMSSIGWELKDISLWYEINQECRTSPIKFGDPLAKDLH
jgi:hypothetical protein